MRDLILKKVLPGTTTRHDLTRAGLEMAASLARELGRRRTAYREIYLEAAAEDGVTGNSRIFPRPQGPEKLPWHVSGLLARLAVPGPLTGLTVRLDGLSPADTAQLTFFGPAQARRESRLGRLLEEMNRESELVTRLAPDMDRRERMLSFYDPFRRKG